MGTAILVGQTVYLTAAELLFSMDSGRTSNVRGPLLTDYQDNMTTGCMYGATQKENHIGLGNQSWI